MKLKTVLTFLIIFISLNSHLKQKKVDALRTNNFPQNIEIQQQSHQMKNSALSYRSNQFRKSTQKSIFGQNSSSPKQIYQYRFKQQVNSNTQQKQEEQPIKDAIQQSWMKYSVFYPQKGETLSSFIENQSGQTDKDSGSCKQIPGKFHHYFVLRENRIQILSNLDNQIASTKQFIDLESLKQLVKNEFKGGVEDMGNFVEGFCFKLVKKDETTFAICADSNEVKQSWMKLIYSYVEKIQINSEEFNNQVSKTDGYWVIVSDWSSCTVACGGGTQTLQRKCVLPTKTARNCEGKSILVRQCNTQDCNDQSLEQNENIFNQLPLQVSAQRLSQRPQTYETCIIKEGDLNFIDAEAKNTQKFVRSSIPVRAILNNKTFAIYKNEQFNNPLFSENLDEVRVENLSEQNNECFQVKISSSQKQIELCGISGIYQTGTEVKLEWLKQIEFFRDKCQDQKNQEELDKMLMDNPLIRAKKEALEKAILKEKLNNFKVQENQKNIFEDEKNLKEQAQEALQELQKEIKYEQSIQLEEIRKEQNEEKQLKAQLEEAREKEECLEREFLQKQQKEQGLDHQDQTNKRINRLKEDVKNLIMKNREEQKLKLEERKKIANLQKQEILDQISNLKLKMASKMIKAQYHGSIDNCQNLSFEEQTKYCVKNFEKDMGKLNQCKDKNFFCQICCENEFGALYAKEKQQCQDQCNDNGGRWVWIPNNNVVEK